VRQLDRGLQLRGNRRFRAFVIVENFHGLLMVDYWHASVKPVAMTPAPSGMG
jgi:hypothetical protein